eukprot:2985476-Prymnesium_polylepis.1
MDPAALRSIEAEIQEAKAEVRRSIGKSEAERTAIGGALQIKWHPDRNMNTSEMRRRKTRRMR